MTRDVIGLTLNEVRHGYLVLLYRGASSGGGHLGSQVDSGLRELRER